MPFEAIREVKLQQLAIFKHFLYTGFDRVLPAAVCIRQADTVALFFHVASIMVI